MKTPNKKIVFVSFLAIALTFVGLAGTVRAQPGQQEIQELVEVFDDRPFNEDQREIEGEARNYTPRHVWKWVTEETVIGLHFDDPNPEEATQLDYIVVGTKGLFTEESKPDEEFSHFHSLEAESWGAAHGGEEGDRGYWLTHIAVREIEYPFHAEPIGPQVDYGFMPTPPPEGSEGHTTDFKSPKGNEGSLSAEDRDALIEIFDYSPFVDAQKEIAGEVRDHYPRHIWWQANEDVIIFLHFNDPNPEEATELDYFGMGVEGQFIADFIPADQQEDFTHFHRKEAESWGDGHGGERGDEGYWLVHHSLREIQYPFHAETIDVGIDREFMPTEVPEAQQGDLTVEVGDLYFEPDQIEAEPGEVIEFEHTGQMAHTVTIEEIGYDEVISPGESLFVQFEEEGVYDLNCRFHPGHDGTITIEE